ncbi:MAG: response regulator transcription factor [Caldilineaceae bacterium]|nr:response regulator transcription factor [Caldilineaceae bacterium]
MNAIRVAMVDDHQSILDGYQLRLSQNKDISIVAAITYGAEIMPVLERQPVDVLLLDITLPTSQADTTPFPVLQSIPQLVECYPEMHVVLMTMHKGKTLLAYAIECGVSGYILKDDRHAIQRLGAVIGDIAGGAMYFSESLSPLMPNARNRGQLLTPRQMEVLALCVEYPNETTLELAQRLNVQHSTARNLLSGIYARLEVNNRTAAVARAQELGIIV